MIDLTPTTLKVNDLRIGENLAKAERHHALSRIDAVTEAKPAAQPAIRMPRISVVRRLLQARPRPA